MRNRNLQLGTLWPQGLQMDWLLLSPKFTKAAAARAHVSFACEQHLWTLRSWTKTTSRCTFIACGFSLIYKHIGKSCSFALFKRNKMQILLWCLKEEVKQIDRAQTLYSVWIPGKIALQGSWTAEAMAEGGGRNVTSALEGYLLQGCINKPISKQGYYYS